MNIPLSQYYSDEFVESVVRDMQHREFVGGLWDEMGSFQLAMLQSMGLQPEHKLLDIGCGALRGGVHFSAYLDPANYFGQDLRQELLDAGYDHEVVPRGLNDRLPRQNLVANDDFRFESFETSFDFALAFSLFTHLPLNHIRVCLERVSSILRPGGLFVATFFERSVDQPSYVDVVQPPGIVVSKGAFDPYHYTPDDFVHAIKGLSLTMRIVGDIGHPRGQKAIIFQATPEKVESDLRALDIHEAQNLPPGADHYRAYVGPPERYDIMSGSQFALLFQLGLRDVHSVLDFGCGSLRLGRLLIPYLNAGNYFGIDPNRWLIEDGLARELGESAIGLKKPNFDFNADFDCSVFGEEFDFVVAQSIITHMGEALTKTLVKSVSQVLKGDGLFLFSYIDANVNSVVEKASAGWHYPHCVSYSEVELNAILQNAGLLGIPLKWFHPGASWYLAAKSDAVFPESGLLDLLNGRTIR